MKNIFIESNFHMRFENGEMSTNSPVHVRRDVYALRDEESPNIYHVFIKNPENGEFLMAPKAMKISKEEMAKITLDGIKENDPENRWGFDFSSYGIQFTMSVMSGLTGQPGTASLWIKDRNIVIVYQ